MKFKVGIVDDHALFRQGIKELIQCKLDCDVIFDVADGGDAIKLAEQGIVPDLLLMDLNLLRVHGKETLSWFNNNIPDVKVIVVSMCSDEQVVTEMIVAGARSFISKGATAETLIECLQTVNQVGWFLPSHLTPYILRDLQRQKVSNRNEGSQLTETDKKILFYLCKEMTHTEIAERMFLSVRTIDDYSNKLAKKLCVKNKAGLIVYAVKNKFDEYILD
ncbi:MAG TPA: hypothetical protein DHW64_10780 [Chitinophagaceae bacterium]|nr:hypothetical protein [Chitinophagaceae bacterium]